MQITKEVFDEWRNHPVTFLLYSDLKARLEHQKEHLSVSAGLDSLQDRFEAGYMQALRDILDADYVEANDD